MLHLFLHKTCMITGASSGIGRGLAYKMAGQGASLLLVSRSTKELEGTAEHCRQLSLEVSYKTHEPPPKIMTCVADVSKIDEVQKIVDLVNSTNIVVNILIANAGASMHASLKETYHNVFQQMLEANYYTAVNIIQALLADLCVHNSNVVVVNSVQSLIGVPDHGAYVAAKHALAGYIETLELEHPELKITETVLGWISGTNIRTHAMDGKGLVIPDRATHRRHSRSTITVDSCVDTIINGIHKQKRYVYLPKFWKNILLVKYFFPRYLKNTIRKRQQYSSKS